MNPIPTGRMRVLFVCSGNSAAFEMAPFIRSQGESLEAADIAVDYHLLKGKGMIGYLTNIPKLFQVYRSRPYDLVHAHYGYTALIAFLALPFRPVVVSFMGSDAYGTFDRNGRPRWTNRLTRLIARLVAGWADHLVVKSPNILNCFPDRDKISILPNGVDLEKFRPLDRTEARRELGLDPDRKIVLFLGSRTCDRKNFRLCRRAVERLTEDVALIAPYPLDPDRVNLYLAAADLLAVTSTLEGSPNVVKEAMACQCRVVSTDVGDVRWLLDGVNGCAVVGFDPDEIARGIANALASDVPVNGRERLRQLQLDSRATALKLGRIYAGLLAERGRMERTHAWEAEETQMKESGS